MNLSHIKGGRQLESALQAPRQDFDGQAIDYVQAETVSGTFTGTTLKRTPTVYGMILTHEGGGSGTWVRVDENFSTVNFDAGAHGTWAGMRTVTDGDDVLVEIPTTYVKTEVINDANSEYNGKTCWWTADGPAQGFHVHPAFVKPDGSAGTLRIAAYMTSKGANDEPMSVASAGGDVANYWSSIAYTNVRSTAADKNTEFGKAGYRAYNIFDHHLLARLMLTEFGTPDVQSQTVDSVLWDGDSRITYHGIHDPFGLPSGAFWIWLDGLTTENGVYNVLNPNGSGTMIATSVVCPDDFGWPVNCRVGAANGVDFGDLFIATSLYLERTNGSFADSQNLHLGSAFLVCWSANPFNGAFTLTGYEPSFSHAQLGWRFAQVE